MTEHATVVVSDNPLVPLSQSNALAVLPGTPIGTHLPQRYRERRVVCRYNGRWILRAGWECPVQPGDVIEFHELVEGDNALRTILQIVVAVIAAYVGGPYGAAIALAGNLAINAFLPLQPPTQASGQSSSPTYNISLSGNQPRPGQAIPVAYGRVLIKCDYACEPYYTHEYDAATDSSEQYLHAVFVIGQGRYQLEQELIGRSRLDGFEDVLVARQLEPGLLPLDVLLNVTTSREVSQQELPSGQYVGGFSGCPPRRRVNGIGFDFEFYRGLGSYDSGGDLNSKTITWRVEFQQVDDFDNVLTAWAVIPGSAADSTQTADTSTPLRISRFYPVTPARYYVRVVRIDVRSDSQRVLNEIRWTGLRGHLAETATLCPSASHYELVLRASKQLSALSQNQFGLVAQRLLRIWHPVTGWTAPGAEVATRNPFHAQMDAWTNGGYVSNALPDSRVDLQTLYDLSLLATARQDRFDYIFDSQMPGWDAASLILRAGRATPMRRNGVHTAVRDQQQTLTVTAYTSRDILPGSFSAAFTFPNERTPDGILAEYWDYRVWDWLDIECPAPGYSVTDPDDPRFDAALPAMSQPVRRRYEGITGPTHCEREGLFDSAVAFYRRKQLAWTTEMQGTLAAFGAEVLLAPALPTFGQSGDVAFWDAATLVMGLSEPPVFTPSVAHFISLVRDDGTLTNPIAATAGPTRWDLVLAQAPDFDLVLDDGTRERPKFHFGDSTSQRQLVRMTGIEHQGADEEGVQTYAMSAVADDERVHLRDNPLLPGPGDVQDLPTVGEPSGGGGGGGGGETILIVDMPGSLYGESIADSAPGAAAAAYMQFTPAGYIDGSAAPEKWMRFPPIEATDAANYEIRATVLSEVPGGTLEGTVGTWDDLGVARTWVVQMNDELVWENAGDDRFRKAQFRIDIRDKATSTVQDSTTVLLIAILRTVSGGG